MRHASILNDSYLKRILSARPDEVLDRFSTWSVPQDSMLERLDRWFGNFTTEQKDLALKVFLHTDYYSADRFSSRIAELKSMVLRSIYDDGAEKFSIVIATASGGGDSSHRHAYDLVKLWGVSRSQVLAIDDLQSIDFANTYLVLFNDTHGSGEQFLETIWPHIRTIPSQPRGVFITAITIAKAAYDKFRKLGSVRIIPDLPTLGARSFFSTDELDALTTIGNKVYPKHPLGFGGTALLTAYYFQCPNNTLPIIWADGSNNFLPGRETYPWSALFPYIPKVKGNDSGDDEEKRLLEKRQRLLREIDSLRMSAKH